MESTDEGPRKWFGFRIRKKSWIVYRCSTEYAEALLRIQDEYDKDQKVFGITLAGRNEIYIVGDQSRAEVLDTLIHELMHAVMYRPGRALVNDDVEEGIIKYCVPRLLDVIRSVKLHDLISP